MAFRPENALAFQAVVRFLEFAPNDMELTFKCVDVEIATRVTT